MIMANRIPPALEPCIQLLPEETLILVTTTISNTPNWLLVRYFCATLGGNVKVRDEIPQYPETAAAQPHGILLVSWLRDWDFWARESRRAGVRNSFRSFCVRV